MIKRVSIFGATGSVGGSVVSVISNNLDHFDVYSVAANCNYRDLARVAKIVRAKVAVIADKKFLAGLKSELNKIKYSCKAVGGKEALIECASEKIDLFVAAISGFVGVDTAFAALGNASTIAIANKESLVAAGRLFMNDSSKLKTLILPLDSEHNSVFKLISRVGRKNVKKILLTASGGPFYKVYDLDSVTPEQALKHPIWSMGPKNSIDSATMVNKGLELIEAVNLFDCKPEQVDVIVHPQAMVHAFVEFSNNSLLSDMSQPDMRFPAAYCLYWPDYPCSFNTKSITSSIMRMEFFELDNKKFPAVSLAREICPLGDGGGSVFNAANEICVEAFLGGRLKFVDILKVITDTIEQMIKFNDLKSVASLEDIKYIDRLTRYKAQEYIAKRN